MSGSQSAKKTEERGETTVHTAPGIDLHLRWAKPAGKPRGSVLVVHGVGEHGGRYGHLERALLDAGWAVYIYDHRGHGRSTGRRVHVARFSDYVDDLAQVYEHVKSLAGEGKVFVYAHSMGGLIATTWATVRRPTLWGLVVAAAPFQLAVRVPFLKVAAAKILSQVIPAFALANEVDPAILSRDPSVGRAYLLDPLVERKATVRWGAEFLTALDVISRRAHELDVPVLLVHGECDQIAAAAGSRAFHARFACADKTVKIYPGCFHELHNEVEADRAGFFEDVVGWLNARAA